ncbi:MAG: aspartate decarboxylase [Maricaulaceae bacterium]|nr:aspartate decarboxylase [Maricaulaceae bacterium]
MSAAQPDPGAPRGSMANPSPYDCLGKLFPEEPYFVLRAKDPAAPGLVEMFAYLYSGQTQAALQKLQEIAALIAAAPAPPRPAGSGKFRECFLISDAMERWRQPGHRESGGAAE